MFISKCNKFVFSGQYGELKNNCWVVEKCACASETFGFIWAIGTFIIRFFWLPERVEITPFVIECIYKFLVCHIKHIKFTAYKINKPFGVTLCFSLWQLMSYQQLQKFCRGNVCCIKIFWTKLGKFGKHIIRIPKNLPAPTAPTFCCIQ